MKTQGENLCFFFLKININNNTFWWMDKQRLPRQEIMEAELVKKRLRSEIHWEYHITDLLGLEKIVRHVVTSGKLIQIKKS